MALASKRPRDRKSWARWAGHLLSAAGLVFVLAKLKPGTAEGFSFLAQGNVVSGLLAPSGLATLAAGLVGVAWVMVLRGLGSTVPAAACWRAHGAAQLAKYLPGNVFHLAGRHLAGQSLGMPHGMLARSAVFELGLVALAASVAAPLLWWHANVSSPDAQTGAVLAISVVAGAIAITLAIASSRRLKSLAGIRQPAPLIGALLSYLVFFALMGAAAAFTTSAATGLPAADIALRCTGAFAVAWLCGFVVPGAPGGLGVRESVFVVLIGGLAPTSQLAESAILMRVASLVGDGLVFVAAGVGAPRANASPTSKPD